MSTTLALLGGKSVVSATTATASATGSMITGFEPSNALTNRVAKSWQAPSGGPHTLTITLNSQQTIYCVSLICAANRPIIGSATVTVKNSVGTVTKTVTLAANSFPGLPDRRHFPIFGGATCKSIEISVASGSYIGHVYAGILADMSSALDSVWELETVSLVKPGALAGRDFVWRSSDRTLPIRARRFSGQFNALDYARSAELFSRWKVVGGSLPVVWIPRGVDLAVASAGEATMMQRTAIWGRFDPVMRWDWIAGNEGYPIWRSRLVITEAL